MLFVETRFFLFFAVVFALHWLLRSNRARKIMLLLASYAFYGSWDWRFLSLIWLSTAVDYVAAQRIEGAQTQDTRRRWLQLSLAVNLGMLGVFKYFGFFVESATTALSAAGFPLETQTLEILLPVGISFYTFQTLSYTIDVWRGKLEARKSLLDVALFVGFFPQLVAGPIVRARDFLPQLDVQRRWADVQVRRWTLLFLVGFVKKACIGDNLLPYIDPYFADPSAYTAAAAWLATMLFTIQVYCDFAGYSDMAIATAGLLGYSLGENFRNPYLARNPVDLWRRWHITLSTWLRDYLYISLGGNRGTGLQTLRNVMLTMVLGGLWHGAAWGFVLWGAAHGLALIGYQLLRPRLQGLGVVGRVGGVVFTYGLFTVAAVFFRMAHDLDGALLMFAAMFTFVDPGATTLPGFLWTVWATCALAEFVADRGWFAGWWQRVSTPVFAVSLGVMTSVAVSMVAVEYQPFIYFQF